MALYAASLGVVLKSDGDYGSPREILDTNAEGVIFEVYIESTGNYLRPAEP